MSTVITAAVVAAKTAAILVFSNPYNVAVMSSALTTGFDTMIDQISHTMTPEEEQLTVSPNLF